MAIRGAKMERLLSEYSKAEERRPPDLYFQGRRMS